MRDAVAQDLLIEHGVAGSQLVCVCCGKGNNGGDGFVIARQLAVRRIPVEVLIFEDPETFSGDAATNFQVLKRALIPIRQFQLPDQAAALADQFGRARWLVDALLGTGAADTVREPYRSAIEIMNAAGKPVLAVDLPSGLDCDTGDPGQCCVRASLTATFVARKRGFFRIPLEKSAEKSACWTLESPQLC